MKTIKNTQIHSHIAFITKYIVIKNNVEKGVFGVIHADISRILTPIQLLLLYS